MDDLPSEVVHQVFSYLNFKDATATRLMNRRFSDIGAEYLETQVRFFTEKGSLQRLRNFAKHPGMCKRINTIVYEGNLLGARCFHEYRDHFKEDHHIAAGGLPRKPADGASARAIRLYNRNCEKWEEAIKKDFDEYYDAYEAQHALIDSKKFERSLDLIATFPNLEHIKLRAANRCGHNLSRRYAEKYKLSCAMPMEMCSEQSTHQLQHLIFPKGKPLLNLKSLHVSALSPKAFMSKPFKTGAVEVFKSLEHVELIFRLEHEDRYNVHTSGVVTAYKDLIRGSLKSSLAAAKDLAHLKINFDDLGYFGPAVDIKDILGDSVWPKLSFLDLDCMKASGDFVDVLKRQPSLKLLSLSFMFLENTAWPSTLKRMKDKLSLVLFTTRGLLEDLTSLYNTFHIDSTLYAEEHEEMSMSELLNDYVTGNICCGPDDEFHPLLDIEWAEPDMLYDLFGYPDSDINMSDMEDVTDSDASSEKDSDQMDVD